MSHSIHRKRLLVACLLLAWTSHPASGQSKPSDNHILARIEKSIEQGRVEEIEQPLLDYALAHPQDARALELLGQVRHRQGRLDEAKALYRRVLVLDPSFVRAKIGLGHVMYELGEREEARRLLVETARSPFSDPRVQLAMAEALALVGEFPKALAAVGTLPAAVKNVEALPVVAASHSALGDRPRLTALIPLMRRAAVTEPFVAARCAVVLQKAGMVQQAIDLLRVALGASPDNVGLLIFLGRMETDVQDFVQARRHLNRAVALKPRSADALSSLAVLESAQGNMASAMASLERARTLAPDSIPILGQFVVTAMRAGKPQAAVGAASTLLRLKPDEPEFQYLYGAASLQSGDLVAAEKSLERYVRERPRDPRGCLALGITFAGQHDQTGAAQAQFERCLQLDPANVEAKYQLSLVFKSQGENAKAIQLLEDVTNRDPRHVSALRDLGALYLQTGVEQKALAQLKRAVALNPQDAETHFQLSRLYNRLGESALAQQHLDLFQKLKIQREKGSAP